MRFLRMLVSGYKVQFDFSVSTCSAGLNSVFEKLTPFALGMRSPPEVMIRN